MAVDDEFERELTAAMTSPIDPDWRPCCALLHHWPPGARCDGKDDAPEPLPGPSRDRDVIV